MVTSLRHAPAVVAAFLIAGLTFASTAQGAPVAIVEDVTGSITGVEVLDYVEAGQTIEVKGNGVLVLGYLKSCVRETIRGGKITVGTEHSEVSGGKVERQKNPCDGGKLQLTAEQAGKSGAMVFRKAPTPSGAAKAPQPDLTIYATSPVVTMPRAQAAARKVTFERLDQPAPPIAIDVNGTKSDLAKSGVRLAPGGLYRASQGERSIVIKVDAQAAAGGGPVVGRLIQF